MRESCQNDQFNYSLYLWCMYLIPQCYAPNYQLGHPVMLGASSRTVSSGLYQNSNILGGKLLQERMQKKSQSF